MPDITKLQRHIDLIAYLVGRRLPVPVVELMEKIPGYAEKWVAGSATDQASVRRTFERDKDELRAFGIPLRTIRYSVDNQETEGYEITRRDFYLPYLKLVSRLSEPKPYESSARPATVELEREHAPLALRALERVAELPGFPFAHEARSAFRKLAFDLDPSAFASDPGVIFADRPNNAELAASLRILSDALLARRTVAFRYRGIHRDEESARRVNGYGLLFQGGQWYLVGHDLGRDAMRVFRAGRMSDVAIENPSHKTPAYELPADFTLADYVGRKPWELGDQDEPPMTARVRFRFPLSLWAERNAHGELEASDADGSAVRRFVVQQPAPFVRWLLGMRTDVEILEPVELRQELKALAGRIAQAHSEGGDAAGE